MQEPPEGLPSESVVAALYKASGFEAEAEVAEVLAAAAASCSGPATSSEASNRSAAHGDLQTPESAEAESQAAARRANNCLHCGLGMPVDSK